MTDHAANELGELREIKTHKLVRLFNSTIFIFLILFGFVGTSYFLFSYLPLFFPERLAFPFEERDADLTAAELKSDKMLPQIKVKKPLMLLRSESSGNVFLFKVKAPRDSAQQAFRLFCLLNDVSVSDTLLFKFPSLSPEIHNFIRVKFSSLSAGKTKRLDSLKIILERLQVNTDPLGEKIQHMLLEKEFRVEERVLEKDIHVTFARFPYIFTIIWSVISFLGLGEIFNLLRKIVEQRKKSLPNARS